MSPRCSLFPWTRDYWSAAVVWHNVMLTVRSCDALSSFARPGSFERSRRRFPGRRGSAARIYRWEKTTAVAVKIKLKRLGKIREPYYRIVVADARTKRDGRAIEEIGKYHPKAEPSLIEVNSERVQHWLSVGAQPTDPVRVLLKVTGDWQKFTGEPGAEGTLRTAAPRGDAWSASPPPPRKARPARRPATRPRARPGPRATGRGRRGKARAAGQGRGRPRRAAKAETAQAETRARPRTERRAETARPRPRRAAETAQAETAQQRPRPRTRQPRRPRPRTAQAETAQAETAQAETAQAETAQAAQAEDGAARRRRPRRRRRVRE